MEKTTDKEILNLLAQLPEGQQILLYDGVCNLCNGFVQFVLKRDKEEKFLFAALQSKIGQQLLQYFQLSLQLETVVLIDRDTAYTQSDVPLKVGQTLGGWMKIAFIGWLFPKIIRNGIYDFIAANRYRIFGKKDQCMMPKPEWKWRFLDI